MKKRFIAFVIALITVSYTNMVSMYAQAITQFEGSTFSIEGTSTLHNWTVEVSEIRGEMTLSDRFAEEALPVVGAAIEDLKLFIPVNKLDGGKEVMNTKMHKALKEPEHPEIIYELKSAEVTQIDESTGEFQLQTTGNITVAGITQPAEMLVTGKKHASDGFEFQGSHPLKMSDFEIEPPTAMFGQIVTGDEITIKYNLVVSN